MGENLEDVKIMPQSVSSHQQHSCNEYKQNIKVYSHSFVHCLSLKVSRIQFLLAHGSVAYLTFFNTTIKYSSSSIL